MRNRYLSRVFALCITVAVMMNSVPTNHALAAQTLPSIGLSCVVYASNEESSKDSQLVTMNLRTHEVVRLGRVHNDYNIEGLAISSGSQTLYAISGPSVPLAGNLYTVDLATGDLNPIGDTGFKKLSGLAIQPLDGTLWSWEKGTGLIRIDPTTAVSTLQFSSSGTMEDLVWSPDGSVLYAVQGKSLYIYTPQNGTLEKVATNLPSNIRAAEIRPDGLLLISQKKDDAVHLFAYDPASAQLVMDTNMRSTYDDIEAIAWPSTCGNASPGGKADFIQSVTVDKSQICSGESVLVSVIAEHPESAKNPVDISINGAWGPTRYVQFTGAPGVRQIHVTAATAEKYIDLWDGQVEVIACDQGLVFPILGTRMNQFQDFVVDIDVLNANEFEADNPSYLWEFGDGQTLTTTTPFISHDYSAAIDMAKLYTAFQADVTLHRDGHPDVSTPKTITVWNLYAINRQRGIIQPRVTYDPQLTPSSIGLVGSFSARNFENELVQFTSRQIELEPCDPNQDPIPLAVENYLLELPPNQELAAQVEIPITVIPADVCDIAVYLTGSTASKVDAFISLYFVVKENDITTQPVDDAAMKQLLNDIVARGLVKDPYHITEADLYDLARAGKITYPPVPITASSSNVSKLVQAAGTLQANLGEPCVPDAEPPRPGITCQATGEWVKAPSHISNAHKGDIIVAAACSTIRGLLQQVSPPQRYSHTGMMTQNYYQIRHSTASTERYQDYGVGFTAAGSDGIRVDVVKYGWPGTITQSVEQAFNGQWMIDPESGQQYEVAGFAANPILCNGDTEIIYPVVVKPTPGSDPSIRTLLRSAADAALGLNGHYRFFSYTNGATAEDPNFNGPAKTGWAKDTLATVCTTFIWTALRSVGINLEGPVLEIDDFKAGAERDTSTPDGLYFYTEPERKAGAEWLWDYYYNLAYEKAGWLGTLFTDAPSDVANEIVNCFANDTCKKDSVAWQTPGVGRSVSPDNIFFWDSPQTGGVYGYNEKLIYRQTGYRAETIWKPSEGVGTIEGQVLLNGFPAPEASVTILTLELSTDQDGRFQDNLIPAGTYSINASKLVDGKLYYDEQIVTVQAGQTTSITLNLEPPPTNLRQITLQGVMKVHDDELIGGSTKPFNIFETRFLNPDALIQTVELRGCVDDEVSAITTMTLSLLPDNSIQINTETKLYDDDGPFGFNCYEQDDVVAVSSQEFIIPPDSVTPIEIPHLEDDGDWVEAKMDVSNELQP